MKSLEQKSEPMFEMPMTSNFPQLCVDDTVMPEIKGWEVGKTYMLKIKVKMTKKEVDTDIDGTDTDADFDILSYEVTD